MFLSYRRGDSHELGITKCSFCTVEGGIWSGKYKMNAFFLQEKWCEVGNAKWMYFPYRRGGSYGLGNGQWMFSYVKGDMEWEMQNECSFLSTIFSYSTPTLKSLTKKTHTHKHTQNKKTWRRGRRWKRKYSGKRKERKEKKRKEKKERWKENKQKNRPSSLKHQRENQLSVHINRKQVTATPNLYFSIVLKLHKTMPVPVTLCLEG